jgi:hypothetical protein
MKLIEWIVMKQSLIIFLYIAIYLSHINLFADEGLYLTATMNGEKNGDQFSVVAGVGDVNNDGFDDVLVGAPDDSAHFAKLYFGGSPFDTIADLRFEPEYPNIYQFAWSVSGKGDVNSDGFDDIVIGQPSYGEFQPGIAYVYYGGNPMDNIVDVTLYEFGFYYALGSSVSIAGDINYDGYEDIVVAAPNDDYDARGRVYVYYGGNPMDNTYDVYLEGQDHFDMFGYSVSGAGDVNNDSYDDLLVSAWGSSQGKGKLYLFFGGQEVGFTNCKIYNDMHNEPSGNYGRVVSGINDINGDTYADFGVMSLSYISLYSGKTLELMNEIFLTPEWQSFNYLSDGGDLNKDGYFDVLVSNNSNSGIYSVMTYLGSSDFDANPDIIINDPTQKGGFGYTLDFAGDINKDTLKEIIIGQYYSDSAPGKAFIYTYGPISSIEQDNPTHITKGFCLEQNYPNPFNSNTTLVCKLSEPCQVSLDLFNSCGQNVKQLLSAYKNPGTYSVNWDGKDNNNHIVPSGIYYLIMKVKQNGEGGQIQQEIKKLVFLK